MRIHRPTFFAAAFLAAIAASAALLASSRPADARAPLGIAAATPEAAIDAAPPASGESPSVARAAPAAAQRLSVQVDRLSRSGNPVDAFAAYRLVTQCLWAREGQGWLDRQIAPADRAQLPTPQTACDDIASDQIQSRLRWLEVAAAAGVHHAATALAREGPDGLGLASDQSLDSPQFADWRARVDAAFDAGVHTCDSDSLDQRVNAFETGQGADHTPDASKALTYWVASVDCRQRFGAGRAARVPNGEDITRRLESALDPGQVAAALAAGHALASSAQPLPGDS